MEINVEIHEISVIGLLGSISTTPWSKCSSIRLIKQSSIYWYEYNIIAASYVNNLVGDPVDNRSSKPTAASAGVKTNIFTEPELPSFEAVSLKGGCCCCCSIFNHMRSHAHCSSSI